MVILLAIVLHWYISLFFQTFFHHRYSAHKMFTMSKPMEKVFYILSWITQGSSYLSPRTYGILHRLHHAYADTEKDPHSPKYDKNLFAMMWRTKEVYSGITYGTYEVEDRFMTDLPTWRAFDRFASSWPSRLGWAFLYILFYVQFATEWWMFLFLPIHFVSGPLHGAVINWFAHKYGWARHEVNDTSKNIFPFDWLMLGEGYHNNHHKYPARPNFGMKWYEFDPVYPFILLFNAVGIIKLRRQPVAS